VRLYGSTGQEGRVGAWVGVRFMGEEVVKHEFLGKHISISTFRHRRHGKIDPQALK